MTHPGLAAHATTPEGRAWIEALPGLVAGCARDWGLEVGEPFAYASASLAMPATRHGKDVVLKVQFPHRECEHEAEALRVWDGDGAVRLLAHDAARHALLLERCLPGKPLTGQAPELVAGVLAALLPRLWKSASAPFISLADEAEHWRQGLEAAWITCGQPFERDLLDAAYDAMVYLPASSTESVLLHQDLHGGNVLSAEREPWLVIDPKPLCGERAFSLAPIIRSPELGHSRQAVIGRLDGLSQTLNVDRERARLWALAQTIAWCFEGDGVIATSIDVARWLHTA